MKITYYGHSCFAAEINGEHLLFDPFITQNPLAKAVDIKKSRPTTFLYLTDIMTTLPILQLLPARLVLR